MVVFFIQQKGLQNFSRWVVKKLKKSRDNCAKHIGFEYHVMIVST